VGWLLKPEWPAERHHVASHPALPSLSLCDNQNSLRLQPLPAVRGQGAAAVRARRMTEEASRPRRQGPRALCARRSSTCTRGKRGAVARPLRGASRSGRRMHASRPEQDKQQDSATRQQREGRGGSEPSWTPRPASSRMTATICSSPAPRDNRNVTFFGRSLVSAIISSTTTSAWGSRGSRSLCSNWPCCAQAIHSPVSNKWKGGAGTSAHKQLTNPMLAIVSVSEVGMAWRASF